jgi:heme-degrading monooxygenase HmoA
MPTIVTIFRSRLRPEHAVEYGQWAKKIYDIAITMPGFISFKVFTAEDGERVSLVEFDSPENVLAWRNHPEHRQAQELGQKLFYSEYRIQVCQTMRDYSFPKKS